MLSAKSIILLLSSLCMFYWRCLQFPLFYFHLLYISFIRVDCNFHHFVLILFIFLSFNLLVISISFFSYSLHCFHSLCLQFSSFSFHFLLYIIFFRVVCNFYHFLFIFFSSPLYFFYSHFCNFYHFLFLFMFVSFILLTISFIFFWSSLYFFYSCCLQFPSFSFDLIYNIFFFFGMLLQFLSMLLAVDLYVIKFCMHFLSFPHVKFISSSFFFCFFALFLFSHLILFANFQDYLIACFQFLCLFRSFSLHFFYFPSQFDSMLFAMPILILI